MKTFPATLLVILLAAGCNGHDVPPPSVTAPPGDAKAEAPQPLPEPGRITPADWLSQPIYSNRNPFDLPLEYDVKLPELPPKEVVEPSPEFPPEETQ